MNERIVLTDDLLRRALAQRMAHAPGEQLLGRIVAGAETTAQDRAPRSWLPRLRPAGLVGAGPVAGRWGAMPALGGVAAMAVALVLIAVALRPTPDLPGTSPSIEPSPSPSTGPTLPLPEQVAVGAFQAEQLRLPQADPIDLLILDGSVWTADIHGDDVRRFDAATLEQLADVQLTGASGPAWFTTADGDVWVTHQLGRGLSRIDPETNQVVATVDAGPTCGAPVVLDGEIWQSICDGGTFVRIDAASSTLLETIPAEGHGFLVEIGGRLITVQSPDTPSATALAELDPADGSFTPLPFSIDGFEALLAADGETLWVMTIDSLQRIDPDDGRVIATFPYTDAQAVSFIDGRAWITSTIQGAIEIDLATNEELRRVPIRSGLTVAREADGVLWATSFGSSYLWRVPLD